jgi:hypothetical protein
MEILEVDQIRGIIYAEVLGSRSGSHCDVPILQNNKITINILIEGDNGAIDHHVLLR